MLTPWKDLSLGLRRSLIILAMSLVAAMAVPSTAMAMPPPGYPTAEVLSTPFNSRLAVSIPIRRGFYDSANGLGFGLDKAWHRHNIKSLKALENLARSNNIEWQGTSAVLRTWAGLYKCVLWSCRVTKQVEVRFIYVSTERLTYAGWPAGGDGRTWGLQTAYCEQGGALLCPEWVWFSLQNPGIPNPYSRTSADSQATPPSDVEIHVSSDQPLPSTISRPAGR